MKRTCFFIIVTFLSVQSFGQQQYFWSGKQKHYFAPIDKAFIVKFSKTTEIPSAIEDIKQNLKVEHISYLKKDIGYFIAKNIPNKVSQDEVANIEGLKDAIPVYMAGSQPIFFTGEVLVQPDTMISIGQILSLIDNDAIITRRTKYGTYVLQPNKLSDVFEYANTIYESGLVKYSHPNFITQRSLTGDPYYSDQFYLNNTGQLGGTSGIDINAPEAWGFTKGDPDIVVAVIDDGVEDHDELTGRINEGYTPQVSQANPDTKGEPNANNPRNTDYPYDTEIIGHGQACSGIIAASHNNIGIKGVAPNVKLVSINIFNDWTIVPYPNIGYDSIVFFMEDALDIEDAIDWAWDDGEADVLSNSWGYNTNSGSGITNADNIVAAIGRARSQGRNGNGSIVVFASGNYHEYFTGVTFPADVNGVVTTGAVDNDGDITSYSSRGPEMDLVAPSSGSTNNVRTIDREGSAGYVSSDYYTAFSGTSAACPQVSGVVALMLSIDPSLDESEVVSTLQQSATDMGTTGFDNTYGYGRLNAYDAIEEIFPNITDHTLVCSSNKTFTLSNIPSGSTISWSKSSNLTPVDSTSTTYTVRAANIYTKNGEGWVQASIDAGNTNPIVVRQNLFVGVPKDASGHRTEYDGVWEDEYCPYDFFGFELIHDNPAYAVTNYDWIINGSSSTSLSPCKDVYTQGEGYEVLYVEIENTCGHSGEYDYGYMVTSSACEQGEGGEFDYKMFPNPAESFITIDLTDNDDIEPDILINIADQQSRIVKTLSIKSNYITIPISDLLPGMYYVEVKADMKSKTKTLIIGKK